MNKDNYLNIIYTISDKEVLKNLAITAGVIIGAGELENSLAQQKTKTTDKNKIVTLDDLKFKIPVDPLKQGYNGPVTKECEPKITIQPDSTFYKLLGLKNRTPEQEKQLRDYLMEVPNSVIIPGRVISIDPVSRLNPHVNYDLRLSSENNSRIEIYSAEEMFKMLRSNNDMNRADRRILEQTVRSTYNRQLPDATRTIIENSVADQFLLSDEQHAIAESLKEFGLDGVIYSIVNKHDGGLYNGKKVKGETVVRFVHSPADVSKDTVKVFVADTTSRGYSGRDMPSGPAGKPNDSKDTLENNNSFIRLNEAGVGIFYNSNGEMIPNGSIGIGLINTNGQSKIDFDLNSGYWKFRNDNIPGEEIIGPFGKTTNNSGKITEDEFNVGASLTAGGDFKMGIGAEYFKHMNKINQTFDELLRDHQGNIVKDFKNEPMPGTGDFKNDALMFGPAMKYKAENISFNAKALFGPSKPAYYFGTSIRLH